MADTASCLKDGAPSADGLTTERNSDGEGYSSWYSYNLWAAANVMEAVGERFMYEE